MSNNPEDRMKQFSVPGPSDALKERVMAAARAEWSAPVKDEDVFWLYPVLKLAAAIALAFTLVGLSARSDKWGREYAQFFDRPQGTQGEAIAGFDLPAVRVVRSLRRLSSGADARNLLKSREELLGTIDAS